MYIVRVCLCASCARRECSLCAASGGERGDAGGASPLEDELSSFDDDDLLDDLEGTEGDDLGAVGDRAGAGEDVDSDGY